MLQATHKLTAYISINLLIYFGVTRQKTRVVKTHNAAFIEGHYIEIWSDPNDEFSSSTRPCGRTPFKW
ncbi:unnamed protein product [Commensalibacter communis]|uniref:Uncharacterized protein n=1 Tax=Commensalibacter communis TaxID=2972786 RepID=A0A9W4X728_9PROT|nr:unnamed protein product [Commensalibacter communis]CAI3923311.1 unnamed protein product [Commensalibacter communis]CAI3935498.1 unnamed protein product [Commensalibacter communis]CAI3945140.1 unnamed protein product [Commensalibacter communis]CAI3946636.1 unnamed protein product [Commensalibacter communis]